VYGSATCRALEAASISFAYRRVQILAFSPPPPLTWPPTGEGGDQTVKNVEMKVDGNILTITVDLSKDFGKSSSGKSIIVASTEGNMTVPGREEKIGLNIYRKE
jgi:hypothetical protein